ncbi:hypothetical protein ES332_A04G027000v1 [Gossypium tomentosum]|uniref:Uncharacterized protein n=1 Tax=Gossypium tomentosum TaxID=34277 RepID=A0A5D2QXR7_GOSTO|nr:hypothetical protein ES332_A04G027000v1 [Gossypium tomentosum]
MKKKRTFPFDFFQNFQRILSNPLPLTPFQAVTLAVGPPWLGRSSVVGGGRDHKIELFSQPFSTFKKSLKLNSLLEIKKKRKIIREKEIETRPSTPLWVLIKTLMGFEVPRHQQ